MSERVLPVLQLANQITRGNVELVAAYEYAVWTGNPCGGADSVRALTCSVTGDIAYRRACKVDRADAVIIVIGDLERLFVFAYGQA